MADSIAVLQSLMAGYPLLLLHFAVALLLWLAALAVYYRLTPHNELKLIRHGNVATAVTSGGVAMGLALPLAFCLAGSVSIWDIVIWSIPILLTQLATFYALSLVIGDLPRRLEENDLAAAIFEFMMRMSSSFLVTAAIAG